MIHLLTVFSKKLFPVFCSIAEIPILIVRRCTCGSYDPLWQNSFNVCQSNTDFSHFIGFSLNQKSAKGDNHHCNCAIKLKQKSNAEILPWIFSRNDDNREILRMQPSYQNRGWDQCFHHKKGELRIAKCQLGCSMLQV